MKAKKVNETQNFERGLDPKKALKVGVLEEDPTKRKDPEYRYKFHKNGVEYYLYEIKKYIKNDELEIIDTGDGKNWERIGTMNEVKDNLKEIYDFLYGDDDSRLRKTGF